MIQFNTPEWFFLLEDLDFLLSRYEEQAADC